tara:strand:- start:5788 stop:6462 length:675 start_codon:yes stop_codon:yes gene_type:complete
MAALDEFISSFSKYGGPAMLSRFEVRISAPATAIPSYSDDRHMSLRVETVTMPGKNIRTVTNENVYGPTHEMAQGLTYAETVSMTFFLSAEHFERNYIQSWMDFIYKPNNYNLEYYKEYNRPIQIFQLDKNGKRLNGMNLNEAFPKTLGPIEYTQTSTELARQEVSFSFKDITFIDSSGNSISKSDSRSFPQDLRLPVTPQGVATLPSVSVDPYPDAILRGIRT